MFRRFADRIGSLVYGGSSDDGMTALQSMGFDAEQARGALNATNGDVDRAAELLLVVGADTVAGRPPTSPSLFPPPEAENKFDQGDNALQRALQESMKTEGRRLLTATQHEESLMIIPPSAQQRNNTMQRAAEAAQKRAATKSSTIKTIKAPQSRKPTFVDKVKEAEVNRCCELLVSYPNAVDNLYRAITAVQNDPDNENYRNIVKSSTGYKRTPGPEAFLLSMNFVSKGADLLTLERSKVDPALLLFGASSLEKIKDSFQYQDEKRKIEAKRAFSKKERALIHHHPEVKVPAKLQEKSKEEQILRCTDRLKPYPAAVDTLYRALSAVQKDPDNEKFRKIDKTTAGYQRSVEGAPGAEALLRAVNFHPNGTSNTLFLERSLVDPALLFLGISALEKVKETVEYKEGKRKSLFAKEIQEVRLSGDSSEAEAIRRAGFLSKSPSEPSEGRGAFLQVAIGEESVRRRFDCDDILRDVLNWLGGHGSIIPDKILSREWCLVDLNRYPMAPIDCEGNMDKTLQYIGCWPSGRLEILPSSDEWRLNGCVGTVKPGSSRGLGSGPMDFC